MRKIYVCLMVALLVMNACASSSKENVPAPSNNQTNNSPSPTPSPKIDKPVVGTDPETSNQDDNFVGITGVMEKQFTNRGIATLREIRTAQYSKYDRIVFDFREAELPSYHIEYVDKPVRQCGSGDEVRLAGDGWMSIKFTPAQAHDDQGNATIGFREKRLDYKVFKELKSICDFEADVNWVLGVGSPNQYRVLEFSNPTRLVIDINHAAGKGGKKK